VNRHFSSISPRNTPGGLGEKTRGRHIELFTEKKKERELRRKIADSTTDALKKWTRAWREQKKAQGILPFTVRKKKKRKDTEYSPSPLERKAQAVPSRSRPPGSKREGKESRTQATALAVSDNEKTERVIN